VKLGTSVDYGSGKCWSSFGSDAEQILDILL